MECNRTNCQCSHTNCYQGLVTVYVKDKGYNLDGTEKEYEKPVVYPCEECDAERHRIFFESKSTKEYVKKMAERNPKNRSQYYEEYENNKTRIF